MSKQDAEITSKGGVAHVSAAPRRSVLLATLVAAFLLIGAATVFACAVYWGTSTIENLSTDSGEYTVVGDPSAGMDRCDGAGSGTVFSASNDNPDTVRVEIDAFNSSVYCDAPNHGDTDGDGTSDHSLADANAGTDDDPNAPVYISTYNGDAYLDANQNGVYEDGDSWSHGSEEPGGNLSQERIGSCMGSGHDSSDRNYKAGPIDVVQTGNRAGQFDPGDSEVRANGGPDRDQDGVNDVDITIDEAPDSTTGHAGAVCVSQGGGFYAAPPVPLEIS